MCDVAYALLVEEFQGDGRAVVSAGEERPPASFRALLDEVLIAEGPAGRDVPPEERELRDALGVA
ncbi:hypothetical protein [Terrabacter terrigena]|uniref:Uncharacterized protein n=1 Tax=Terrabacter terrigena TaxID=574718 RepID=A0ABW3MZU8_9MICO